MAKYAVNRVYINNEKFYNNHVVELLNGFVTSHYPLEGEISMTEWIGGAILLIDGHKNFSLVDLSSCNSLSELFSFFGENANTSYIGSVRALHISNLDYQTGRLTAESELQIL